MLKKTFICLICLFFYFNFLIGEEFHVTNGDEFQAALTAAAENDEDNVIFMASGVYYRTDEAGENYANFRYRERTQDNSLTIKGEEGTSASDVVIDAHSAGWCLDISSGPLDDHLETPEINITGITFQNGNSIYYSSGLGISCSQFKVIVSDCIIKDNITSTLLTGGGVEIHGKSIFMENNKVFRNSSIGEQNRTYYFGGYGGGMYLVSHWDEITLKNNIIANNMAFAENDAFYPSLGGGIYLHCYNDAEISLVNNTIFGNVADEGGGLYLSGIYDEPRLNLYNNIIYNNIANLGDYKGDVYCEGDNIKIYAYHNNYTDFDYAGSFEESVNNVDIDPGFEAPITGDFHLPEDSPMIDAGTESVPTSPGLPDYDYEGDPRVHGPAPDIGADEYTGYMFSQFSLLRARWLPDRELLDARIYIWDLDKIKLEALVNNENVNEEVEIWIVQVSEDDIKFFSGNNKWSDKEKAFYLGTIDKEFKVEVSKFEISKYGLYDYYIIVDKKIDGKITLKSMVYDFKTLIVIDDQQK